MTLIEAQLQELKKLYPAANMHQGASGAVLIVVPGVKIPPGWNHDEITILFVAPVGYPQGRPDCFWAEPLPIRLAGGATPQASNDSNPIPDFGQRGTWFSWHVQSWNQNKDSLLTYMNVIKQRFEKAQ